MKPAEVQQRNTSRTYEESVTNNTPRTRQVTPLLHASETQAEHTKKVSPTIHHAGSNTAATRQRNTSRTYEESVTNNTPRTRQESPQLHASETQAEHTNKV
ncbi:unnamed protein product, partial [Ectocarpus fasciculatus]